MFHHNTSRVAAMVLLLSTAALPQTGYAASYLDALPKAQKTSYTASLAEITQGDSSRSTRTLDWRQPTLQLYFDLPPAERTSEIVLTLSADPLTRVAANAPLQVQFNNAKPVPVLSNGRGFEARIPLDAANARDHRNSLRIIYPTPAGSECVIPDHGEWSIDLAASTLQMGGRAKRRNMSLAEVDEQLSQPALSPKTVGLIARGANGTDMQALAAQGIALRTPGVPKFSVTSHGNDFNVVMVKRDRLFDITDDPMILNSKGARIFVGKGRPTDLIFTADTDAEILRMLEIFSTRQLPNTRRPITSLGEINLQNRLDDNVMKVEGKVRLSELGGGQAISSYSGDNWASGAQTYRFSVQDPVATKAELLLRLSTTDDVADTSRLRVALNGEVLGAAKLDRKRKSVAFDIDAGKLNATSNIISVLPELDAKPDYSCASAELGSPSFTIGQGSRLTLKQTVPSPQTELSRLTATGGIFAEAESYIILPRDTRNYEASLRVLGKMAKASGQGLILADYTRKDDTVDGKHRLIIGPSDLAKRYIIGAPKSLREALQGRTSAGDNMLRADIERFASTGADDFAVQYASAQAQARKVNQGGVAALYSTGSGKLTGVISATSGANFIRSSGQLIETAHWNALQGGVSRWNKSSVIMAQTAQPVLGLALPSKPDSFRLPELDLPSFEMPDVEWPDLDWPNFAMPNVSLPAINWPSFRKSEAKSDAATIETVSAPVMITPVNKGEPMIAKRDIYEGVSPAATAPKFIPQPSIKETVNVMPRLKPTFRDTGTVVAGLRGRFEMEAPAVKNVGSFHEVRSQTSAKWTETKRWFKAKKTDIKNADLLKEAALFADRLQDRAKPAGRSIRSTMKQDIPGKRLVQLGDRTVSVYGLLLILAFGIVLFLMSVSGPSSRLGGRH